MPPNGDGVIPSPRTQALATETLSNPPPAVQRQLNIKLVDGNRDGVLRRGCVGYGLTPGRGYHPSPSPPCYQCCRVRRWYDRHRSNFHDHDPTVVFSYASDWWRQITNTHVYNHHRYQHEHLLDLELTATASTNTASRTTSAHRSGSVKRNE
ncbi:hypothetical protein BDN72DRAFT_553638 [Pluteus cervinus]|uniref:Uncharacterized protein n=1 Tax=Pluteus cervinus TaxID=181527 RepID=A0ACD3A2Z4_9AGAR|nr:hypothetical protein BDN72DRAFT_553638 [Pluteus cervinus]